MQHLSLLACNALQSVNRRDILGHYKGFFGDQHWFDIPTAADTVELDGLSHPTWL